MACIFSWLCFTSENKANEDLKPLLNGISAQKIMLKKLKLFMQII